MMSDGAGRVSEQPKKAVGPVGSSRTSDATRPSIVESLEAWDRAIADEDAFFAEIRRRAGIDKEAGR